MIEQPRRRFHDLLEALQMGVLELAGASEAFIQKSTDALLSRDGELAAALEEEDAEIDHLELEVDERALELLALQQPIARDLRQVMAALKIANDLERVGDHAVKICHATAALSRHPPLPELPELAEMIHAARRMLADALRAYTSRDPRLAREVRARDDRVDELRNVIHRILVRRMLEDSRRVNPALELFLVIQSVERVADLATNIAEETVFLVEGTVIRHGPETLAAEPVPT
jgi:phosphate transport system protein